jgi:hypothetical protein
MHIRFVAAQSVQMAVPAQPVPIQHYLRQPHRLVNALVDPTRMEQLSDDRFRLKMRPLSFMMLSIQPIVDLKVWVSSSGTVHLESVGCEIRGVEYIDRRFALNLKGQLVPRQEGGSTSLQGVANLEVEVDLPPAFWLTPKPLLEMTGNSLLKSVLLTIKQRLIHQLLSDYSQWASSKTPAVIFPPPAILSPHS